MSNLSQIENLNYVLQLSETEKTEFLLKKPFSFFENFKKLDELTAHELHKLLKNCWKQTEERVFKVEKTIKNIKYKSNSLEEGRCEILTELFNKSCQAFEIYNEHQSRKIPTSHRLVLESSLLIIINNSFDLILKICNNFSQLFNKKDEVDIERDTLRLEIRFCDIRISEVHEKFLKSFLGMKW